MQGYSTVSCNLMYLHVHVVAECTATCTNWLYPAGVEKGNLKFFGPLFFFTQSLILCDCKCLYM